jgi:SulP family sulfate permease
VVRPVRGDLVAGVSVALVLIPQAMAYAKLAGLDPVHGLYAAVAAPLAGAVVGSSPYLQTGPVAVTSLLTFGALNTLGDPYTAGFALLAGLLAILVGLVRLGIGLVGGGPIAYLMSQPVVVSFTTAAAVLIISSQLPGVLGAETEMASPFLGAVDVLTRPADWGATEIGLGLTAIVVMVLGRRYSPLFPGPLLVVATATAWSAATGYGGPVVGDFDTSLTIESELPWGDLGHLLLPALVIAVIGFAEPAAIARKYAAEDRRPWDPNREFVGQGLANLAAGAAGGYPVGGSFSRTALNRRGGARTRWSGAVTGLTVLVILPFAGVLSALPVAVLSGIVIAAVTSLVDLRTPLSYWRWSRPQSAVAMVTVVSTLALAPRVDQGVLVGVGTALAVHLWRELNVGVPSEVEDDTLHVWPTGVLYFGSAPGVERAVNRLIAEHPEVARVVVHLGRLGRVDLTGALMLRDVLTEARASGVEVHLRGARAHVGRLLSRVLEDDSVWE